MLEASASSFPDEGVEVAAPELLPPPKKLPKGVEDIKLEAVDALDAESPCVDAAAAAAGVVFAAGLEGNVEEEAVFGFARADFTAVAGVAEDAEEAVCLTAELVHVVEGGGNVEEAVRSVLTEEGEAVELAVVEAVAVAVVVDDAVAKPGILEEKMFLDMLDMDCRREGCSVTGSAAGAEEEEEEAVADLRLRPS